MVTQNLGFIFGIKIEMLLLMLL
jgi:hypothetical protein